MWIFQIVGVIVLLGLILFLLLFIVYLMMKRKPVKAFIDPEKMPKLTPVPIPTKNRSFFMKILVWVFEVRKWELSQNWFFKLDDGTEIVLPEDFKFDGASIPRLFWAILSPTGLLLIPGLIHDYGYKYNQLWMKDNEDNITEYMQGEGKSYWDRLFLEVGKQVNGFALINLIAWLGVFIGGSGAWKKHREKNESPRKPKL
jgi:hypothetical protein